MNLHELAMPFPGADIEWRVQRSGLKNSKPWAMVLAYVDNRAIMDRLDAVCGPENWRNEYASGPGGGILCGLSIKVGGEWVTKWDGADNTQIEAVKGGLSGAMKRAAVQWGIGRYLYNLEEGFANVSEDGRYRGSAKKNPKDNSERPTYFRWNPPALPGWALPNGATQPEPAKIQPDNSERDALLARTKKCADSGLLSNGELDAYRQEVRDTHDNGKLRELVEEMEKATEFARKRASGPGPEGTPDNPDVTDSAEPNVGSDDAGADEAFGTPSEDELF